MTFPPQPPHDLPEDPGSHEPEVGPPAPEAPARTRFATPPAATSPLDVPTEALHPVEPAAAVEPEPDEPTPAALPEPAAAELPVEPDEPTPAVALPEPEPEREPSVQAGPALEAPPSEPAPSTRGKGLVAVLAALVVVLAALTGFLAWRVHDTQGAGPVAASRTSALDASRASARLVFSYDYRHLAKDFKAGRAVTTGQFQGEYDKTTAKLVSDVAPRYKAVVVADVSDAAVVSATENQVVTLVFLNQQSASSLVSTPKITQSRLEMTMVRKDGRWLVSKIKAL